MPNKVAKPLGSSLIGPQSRGRSTSERGYCRRRPLQRLFSTFPDGKPGLGLLLLRIAVGGMALVLGVLYFSGLIERSPAVWTVACLLIVSGGMMLIGLMTPLAGLLIGLCVLGITFSWFPAPPLASLVARLAALVIVITAVGLAFLGPGAFSLDGYLFGRREIVIPPRPPDT